MDDNNMPTASIQIAILSLVCSECGGYCSEPNKTYFGYWALHQLTSTVTCDVCSAVLKVPTEISDAEVKVVNAILLRKRQRSIE